RAEDRGPSFLVLPDPPVGLRDDEARGCLGLLELDPALEEALELERRGVSLDLATHRGERRGKGCERARAHGFGTAVAELDGATGALLWGGTIPERDEDVGLRDPRLGLEPTVLLLVRRLARLAGQGQAVVGSAVRGENLAQGLLDPGDRIQS